MPTAGRILLLPVALLAAVAPLSAQVIYGDPRGGNISIHWSHGRASFGVYTHRWYFVSTLPNPTRLCFSYTRLTEEGSETHTAEPTIRPGEQRDGGYWTMSRSAADPPVSNVRPCGDGSTPPRPGSGVREDFSQPPVTPVTTPSPQPGAQRATIVLNTLQQLLTEQANRQEALRQQRATAEARYRAAADAWRTLVPYLDEIGLDSPLDIEAFTLQYTGQYDVRSNPSGFISRLDAGGAIADIAMTNNEERYQSLVASIRAYYAWKRTMDTDPTARRQRAMVRFIDAMGLPDGAEKSRLRQEACDLGEKAACPVPTPITAASTPLPSVPPAATAGPPAPRANLIPGTEWGLTTLNLHEGPVNGVPWAEQKHVTRFSRAVARYIFADLSFVGRAGAPAPANLRCTINNLGWQAETQSAFGALDPSWTALTMVMPGIGWDTPGVWPIGPYDVRCMSGDAVIGRTKFEIVQALDGVNWVATDLELYAGPDAGVPITDRIHQWTFAKSTLSRLYIDMSFELQPGVKLDRPIDCSIVGQGLNGTMVITPQPNPSSNVVAGSSPGFGWSAPGNWPVGGYIVTCSKGGVIITSASFAVQ